MAEAAKLKILVVDDQASMRGIVRNHLKTLGVERIVEAENVRAAIGELSNQMISVVISDFNMEGGSGLDLLKAVRSHPVWKRIPFIMVTGNSEQSVVSSVIQAGVNGYVVKPVSLLDLKSRLEKAVGKLV